MGFLLLLSALFGIVDYYLLFRVGLSAPQVFLATTPFLLALATYLAVLSLARRMPTEDARRLPIWLACATLAWGIVSSILKSDYSLLPLFFNIILYPAIQYYIPIAVLRHKQSRTTTAVE
jgi:hypothetical protein